MVSSNEEMFTKTLVYQGEAIQTQSVETEHHCPHMVLFKHDNRMALTLFAHKNFRLPYI